MSIQSSQATLTPRHALRTGGTGPLLQAWLRYGVHALLMWHERARQRRQLQELTPRDLRDLGLSAADVRHEVSKPFWQL